MALSSKLVDMVQLYGIELLHVHYAIPHAYAGYMAKKMLEEEGIQLPMITTLHGTDREEHPRLGQPGKGGLMIVQPPFAGRRVAQHVRRKAQLGRRDRLEVAGVGEEVEDLAGAAGRARGEGRPAGHAGADGGLFSALLGRPEQDGARQEDAEADPRTGRRGPAHHRPPVD